MISRATLEVFVHPTESERRVLDAVSVLANGLEFTSAKALSHWKSPITVLTAPVDTSKLSLKALSVDARRLISKRMDAEGTLHLRFDKQKAATGKLVLTEGSDCIKLSVHTQNYPRDLKKSEKDLLSLFE